MNIISIIPARGGSKGLPGKNIKSLAGKPLINYSIKTSQDTPLIQRTIVSTDSDEIKKVALLAGAEVPFMRPAELAQDDTLDLPVFEHCLRWLEENENYKADIIVQLRPTSPLRRVAVLEKAIQMLLDDKKADSVRCVCDPAQSPFKMWQKSDNGYMTPLIKTDIKEQYNQPRQTLPEVYWQIGYLDILRRETILEQKSMSGTNILPLILEHSNVVDIDTELSFEMAEILIRTDAY